MGLRAKGNGQHFEDIITLNCGFQKWELLKIPEGCKNTGNGKLILVKSPFDFILAKTNTVVFFDAKTIEDGNFTYSMIKQKQVEELIKLERQGFLAGYLIFFRKEKMVKFARASELLAIQPRSHIDKFLISFPSKGGMFDFNLLKNCAQFTHTS